MGAIGGTIPRLGKFFEFMKLFDTQKKEGGNWKLEHSHENSVILNYF